MDEFDIESLRYSWSGEAPGGEHDVLSMVDALDLDVGSIPLLAGAEQDMMMQLGIPAPPELSGPAEKTKDAIRMDKIRARNREAQARYRQKTKGQAAVLENSISQARCGITTAIDRRTQLHSQHQQLTQRCSNSIAALDAILSVTCMLPDPGTATSICTPPAPQSTPTVTASASASASEDMSSLSGAADGGPSMHTGKRAKKSARIRSAHGKQNGLYSHSPAAVPRPISSFKHQRGISVDYVADFERSAYSSTTDALPHSRSRTLATKHRSSEAAKCGCGVSDIVWFCTSNINVVGQTAAGTAQYTSDAAGDGRTSSCSEMMSYSSTFNSGPCVASLGAIFNHLSLENILAHQTFLSTGAGLDDELSTRTSFRANRSYITGLNADINIQREPQLDAQNKRRRDASGAPVQGHKKPLQSTAAVMESVGITSAMLDACNLRCGIGGLVPMRLAIRNMLEDTMMRYSAILSIEAMRRCIERIIDTQDRMAAGLTVGLESAPLPGRSADNEVHATQTATSQGAAVSQDTPMARAPMYIHSGSEQGDTQPIDKSGSFQEPFTPPLSEQAAALDAESEATWVQQYKQESGLHMVALVVTMRDELMRLLDDLPVVVSKASESQQLTTKAAVLQRNASLVHQFVFLEIVSILDAPKIMFNIVLDSLAPFMGSYFQVDNFHVELYKELSPTVEQRACMLEIWSVWERRKRKLDSDANAAQSLLTSLPSEIPLSHEFLAHLNALTAPPMPLLGHTSPGLKSYPITISEFPSFGYSTSASKAALIHNLESCLFSTLESGGVHGSALVSTGSFSDAGELYKQNGAVCVQTVHVFTENRKQNGMYEGTTVLGQPDSMPWPGVRFLGQFPQDKENAEKIAELLQGVQAEEANLFTDMLDAQVPGVLLDSEQSMRIWSHHFMSQVVPPDFLELCQIAASQQNRRNLFLRPFR